MATQSSDRSKNADVARGAGKALLGRMGAVIEILSVFLFAQMYGSETYGLFLLLWFVVQALAIFSDFGMTMALQRFVPADDDDVNAGRVLKYALSTSLTISCIVSLSLMAAAPTLASFINANERDTLHLVSIIQLYAWAVPLWCLIDVATAAIRARQVFGPEIKVRIFYEQGFRLLFGSLFWFLGYYSFGLFIAHLLGLFVTVVFAFRLLNKYYGLSHLFAKTGRDRELVRQMVTFASSMVLPNLAKKWHSGLPVLVLNLMIPGAGGAEAAGIYGVARKITSFINVFRESLEYVMAPLASATYDLQNNEKLREMFAFATRLSVALIIPAATLIICFREQLLRQSGSEFVAGALVIVILATGRVLEAASGPSTTILTMIGRYRLPFINAVIGVALTGYLAYLWVPQPDLFGGGLMGSMAGAALAAAIGINATSLAAHLEIRALYKLNPYDRRMTHPIVISILFSIPMGFIVIQAADLWRPLHFAVGVVAFLLTLALVVRFGFRHTDAQLIVPKALLARMPYLLPKEGVKE